jgi:glycosyltransferase involved in cell wall biosynthesis
MKSILYISYDGLLEPLGQSQVLSYLIPLALKYKITIVSYEKYEDWSNLSERSRINNKIKESGIDWHPLRYHKSPSILAKLIDIIVGLVYGAYLIFFKKIKILHARSYIPGVIVLMLKFIFRIKFIFDMRGFWADERIDGNLWKKNSYIYKFVKLVEKYLLLNADHIITLTHASVNEIYKLNYLIKQNAKITVIPTCTNLEIFKPDVSQIRINNFTLGYIGSVSTWYLFDEVLYCFSELLKINNNCELLIINKGEHDFICKKIINNNIPLNKIKLINLGHNEISVYIRKMDAGIFFIKPAFSKKASSPTRLGEFLGTGIPCLTNDGIGDVSEILNNENVGVVIKDLNKKNIVDGIKKLLILLKDKEIKERCVKTAKKYFSLENGITKYDKIYNELNN